MSVCMFEQGAGWDEAEWEPLYCSATWDAVLWEGVTPLTWNDKFFIELAAENLLSDELEALHGVLDDLIILSSELARPLTGKR